MMMMEHTIVYKDKNAYSCFPDIVRTRTGDLLVSFRRAGGFSLEAVRRGKYDHVDKGARIALARSQDGGRSWELARIFPVYDEECGEQDPSIAELRDGRLIINLFRWRVVPAAEKHRLGYPARQQIDGSWSDVEGPWVLTSHDGGTTWDEQPTLVDSAPLPRAGTSDAVLELPDGRLLMGIYGADYGSNICRSYVVRSTDGGHTWNEPALIARNRVFGKKPGFNAVSTLFYSLASSAVSDSSRIRTTSSICSRVMVNGGDNTVVSPACPSTVPPHG